MIRKVVYIPENDSIMSSSGSSKTSLILMDTQGKKKSYTFKINKVKIANLFEGLFIVSGMIIVNADGR